MFLNDDGIAFKSDITFEEEGKKARFDYDRVTEGDFSIIAVFNFVREDKFTKTQEGKKKEVIMRWGW